MKLFSAAIIYFLFGLTFLAVPQVLFAEENIRSINLAWNPNSEPDLSGYMLYYKSGTSGPPYNGAEANEGDSPVIIYLEDLQDPRNPQFELNGLSKQNNYFLTLTAFDSELNESAYSNEVSVVKVVTSTFSNISPSAFVQCSSENYSTKQTCDKAVDEIINGFPEDLTKEWAAVKERTGTWIKLDWFEKVSIDKIILHDRPNLNDQIFSGTIRFDDNSTVDVGKLPNDGKPLEILLPQAKKTSSIIFTVNSVSSNTHNIGLSEIAVIGHPL